MCVCVCVCVQNSKLISDVEKFKIFFKLSQHLTASISDDNLCNSLIFIIIKSNELEISKFLIFSIFSSWMEVYFFAE